MIYIRTQMLFNKYYNWEEDVNKRPAKSITDYSVTELSRNEGRQVLLFINWFNEKLHLAADVAIFHKIERLLRFNVPSSLNSFGAIEKWLIENW